MGHHPANIVFVEHHHQQHTRVDEEDDEKRVLIVSHRHMEAYSTRRLPNSRRIRHSARLYPGPRSAPSKNQGRVQGNGLKVDGNMSQPARLDNSTLLPSTDDLSIDDEGNVINPARNPMNATLVLKAPHHQGCSWWTSSTTISHPWQPPHHADLVMIAEPHLTVLSSRDLKPLRERVLMSTRCSRNGFANRFRNLPPSSD